LSGAFFVAHTDGDTAVETPVLAAEAPARARDDRNLTVETDVSHEKAPAQN
jgi:hypothetical protein